MGIGNYSDKNFLSYLNLQNNNGTVKLVGTIKGAGTGTGSFSKLSYSFLNILANYFNLSSSYINTNEIISSTGQYADSNGNFNTNEAPSNWYKSMYGVTTAWQIIFNTESVYFRTEGSLANSGRSNGIQGDAGRELTGEAYSNGMRPYSSSSGIIYLTGGYDDFTAVTQSPGRNAYSGIGIRASRQWSTANEFRVKNRLIRIYKLLTINSKKVSDIIGVLR